MSSSAGVVFLGTKREAISSAIGRSRLCYTPGTPKRIPIMKNLVSVLVALGLAIGFAGAAFAADAPKTKADCEKAKMKWDDTAKSCSKASSY